MKTLTTFLALLGCIAIALSGCNSDNPAAAKQQLSAIGRSVHNLGYAMRELAPDQPAADGRTAFSWRVVLLQDANIMNNRFDKFDRTELWDGPKNQTLIGETPAIYQRPGVRVEQGETVFQRACGNGALFDIPEAGSTEKPRRVKLDQLPDGGSNTILLVESDADNGVIWTKPADHEVNPDDPFAGLHAAANGQTLLLMSDGSVREVNASETDQNMMRSLFTRDGND